jgi:hypothetical protein
MPEMNPVERPGRKDDGALQSGKLPDGMKDLHGEKYGNQEIRKGMPEKFRSPIEGKYEGFRIPLPSL